MQIAGRLKAPKKDLDMCNGPLFGKIITFSLPIMIMNMLQMLFNTTNMVVVGRFSGSKAMAAVGATGSLIALLVNFFLGLSTGISVIIAQDTGANRPEGVSRAVHTAVAVSFLTGVFVGVLGFTLCEPMLRIMGTPDDIIELSTLYMRIYFLGIPALMTYDFCAGILRAVGDSRRPMFFLAAGGVLNVLLCLFTVIVLDWGVAGVAMSTAAAQYLSMGLVLWSLSRAEGPTRLELRKIRIDREKLSAIIRIGLPAGGQSLAFNLSNVFIQSSVNSYGSQMIAASAASGNVENYAGVIMNSFYFAAIAFTGQNMGARKYNRIDSIAKICTVLILATWLVMGGIIFIMGRHLLAIFNPDPEIVTLGMMRLRVMIAAYFTCGMMNVYPGLTRGMGYAVLPMLVTLIGACLLRIVWIYTVFAHFHTETILFAAYPVTWAISGIGQIMVYLYARKKVRREDMKLPADCAQADARPA